MAPQSNLSSMESIDAFKVLGLCSDANARDVRSAFRRISLKLHPDRGGDAEAFRQASQAAELLLGSDSDPGSAGSSEPPIKQRGNVRGFFALDGVVAVVDEACASIQGEAIVRSAHDEVLLCGCALGSQACVGTSKGRIYLAGERGVRTLVGGGPAVLALAAAPPLLVASVAGETTLVEAVEGGAVHCDGTALTMANTSVGNNEAFSRRGFRGTGGGLAARKGEP